MTQSSKPQLELAAPVFGVSDAQKSRDYYVNQLAFEVRFEWSDDGKGPPRYVILGHGKIELHLSQTQEPKPSMAYIFVNGIQQYYEAVNKTDTLIVDHLRDYPWDMREFDVKDPDGNKLVFGEHLSRLESGADAPETQNDVAG